MDGNEACYGLYAFRRGCAKYTGDPQDGSLLYLFEFVQVVDGGGAFEEPKLESIEHNWHDAHSV